MRWVDRVARIGDRESANRVLVGRLRGKRTLGRSRHNWDDNINIDIQEVGWRVMDFIVVAQDRDRWHALFIAVMNSRDL
jgi:hypothetical protein